MSDKTDKLAMTVAALFLIGLSAQAVYAKTLPECDDATSERLQPGRVESARELIAEGKEIKLHAEQSSVSLQDAIRRARGLSKGATSLKGRLGADLPGAVDQYHRDLNDFQDHVKSYRAHLEQVEKDLGHCKETEKLYQEHLKKYTLHTMNFHVPDIPPPHMCPAMQLSEGENTRLANQMKADRQRLAVSEMELAEREAQLRDSLKNDKHADEALLNRSRLTEEERKLAGEFAGLKTELELLNTQHQALLGGSSRPGGLGRVTGVVRQNK